MKKGVTKKDRLKNTLIVKSILDFIKERQLSPKNGRLWKKTRSIWKTAICGKRKAQQKSRETTDSRTVRKVTFSRTKIK